MLFNFLTIFPELISDSLKVGVIGQAIKNHHLKYQIYNLRDYTNDKHKSVDDKPFGGNDGMLMRPEVLGQALDSLRPSKIIFPSPQGRLLTQKKVKALSRHSEITFLCGRYAGIDERVLAQYEIEELSIGDYVVSGGELPALIIMDAIGRNIPQVLGNDSSVGADSFAHNILESPSFTRPQVWKGLKVPDVLIGGDHAKIKNFGEWMSLLITLKKRPELLDTIDPNSSLGQKWANKIKLKEFYRTLPSDCRRSCGLEDLEEQVEAQI